MSSPDDTQPSSAAPTAAPSAPAAPTNPLLGAKTPAEMQAAVAKLPPDQQAFMQDVARVTMVIATHVQQAKPQVLCAALVAIFVRVAKIDLKLTREQILTTIASSYDMMPATLPGQPSAQPVKR